MGFRTVFLDRDGVITEDRDEYILDEDCVAVIPGAIEAVARLNRAGLAVIVVTNQSAVGRGWLDLPALNRIHDRLLAELAFGGAWLDDIFICPHGPDDGCACRKPRPGQLLQAAGRHCLELAHAVLVGDRGTDLEAAHRAGCHAVLVRTGPIHRPLDLKSSPDHIAADLPAAVDWILSRCTSS